MFNRLVVGFCLSLNLIVPSRVLSKRTYVQISGHTYITTSVSVPKLAPVVLLEASEDTQSRLVDIALEASDEVNSDPYGSVLWPAALAVATRVLEYDDLHRCSVLELGTGTGLVALACALGGAREVIATDYHPLTLEVVDAAAQLQVHPLHCFRTELFDVKGSESLPPADIVLIADLLYTPALGLAIGMRINEALLRGSRVILGDSPGRPGRKDLDETLEALGVKVSFTQVLGSTVTGHRHSLISTSNTLTPQAVSIALLELSPVRRS
jgi:predicted nicotinamide N-methyase